MTFIINYKELDIWNNERSVSNFGPEMKKSIKETKKGYFSRKRDQKRDQVLLKRDHLTHLKPAGLTAE